MGNSPPRKSADYYNPWSRARVHIPTQFTSHNVAEIANTLGVQLPPLTRFSCATAAVQELVTILSVESKRSHCLYRGLVLLYDKGVRFESDPVLMQSVHELSQSDKHSERCGFGAINIFCSPSNISTSIEKFSSGDFLIVELEPPTISPQNKVPSSQNRQRSVTIDAAAEPDNQRNFFEPEEALALSHTLKVEHHLDRMFSTACCNSHVLIQPCNVIFLGQTGVGKTSTICHLQDQPLPDNSSSTDLIEISRDIFWQHARTKSLMVVSADDELNELSKTVLASSQIPQPSVPFYCLQNYDSSEVSSQSSRIETDLMKKIRMKFGLETTKADLMSRGTAPANKSQPHVLYQFIDCGGMPFFRNLLPQFFPSTTTLFLLVHNLTDKLHSKARIKVLKDGELMHLQEIPPSNLEEIVSWIDIAHSCSGHGDDSETNTLMVCTHYDKLLKECFNDKLFANEAALMATEYVCRQVVETPNARVLDPDPVLLNNLLAGKTESQGVHQLREKLRLLNLDKEPVTMPVQWAALIIHIRDMSKETKTVLLSLAGFLAIAATYNLDEETAMNSLKKFEELCLVFRMPKRSYLSNFIFVDIQWLFNGLANVLNPPDSFCKKGRFFRDWQSLQRSGFMSARLHSHIVSMAPETPSLPQNWISDLLHHLFLLTKVSSPEKSCEYFCPILLPPFVNKEAQVKDPFLACKQIASVYLCPVIGCIPPGFLARLFTILAGYQELSLTHCTSQLSATFRFSPRNSPKDSYFVRVSECSGAVQIELCNEYKRNVEYMKVCEVTRPVITVILASCRDMASVWIHTPLFENESTDSQSMPSLPMLALKCCDEGCQLQPNISNHFSHVHIKPNNETGPYVQCSLNQRRQHLHDLHASQLVWLWDFIEGKVEKGRVKNAIETAIMNCNHDFSVVYDVEPGPTNRYSCPTVRRVYVSDQKKPVPVSLDSGKKKQKHGFDRMVSQETDSQTHEEVMSSYASNVSTPYTPTSPCSLPGGHSQHLLDKHFDTLYLHLDLQIRADLYQHGLLADDQFKQIASLAEDTSDVFSAVSLPNNKRSALRVLIDALKYVGDRGVMGLIAVLRSDVESSCNRSSNHKIVLDQLQRDSDYILIKENWLRSLTVLDQDSYVM